MVNALVSGAAAIHLVRRSILFCVSLTHLGSLQTGPGVRVGIHCAVPVSSCDPGEIQL